MSTFVLLMTIVPAATLLLVGFLPNRLVDQRVEQTRRWVTFLAGIQSVASILALVVSLPMLLGGSPGWVVRPFSQLSAFTVYYDGFTAMMLALVSFVGFVVCRYAIRYLDGEPQQGRFYRWAGVTIGSVSFVVFSGNLLLLLAAWVLTSLGLHQLLLYYPERTGSQRAAWTKFAISRVGDVLLIAATALVFRQFGTFDLAEIFTAVQGQSGESGWLPAIAWLFILAAVTKSAQFPLHSWLPETMETPTPVSALMHAGIVNAGGYLVIRLSPILVEAPAALAALSIIGTLTVTFAGIVMMTQTSIKRSLAYSTIAQMGFMMLQCGLGAFSAAMLHILAHSLYKAYAFLNSGSVLAEAAGMRKPASAQGSMFQTATLPFALIISTASVTLAALMFGINLGSKSGGLVLAFVLTLALTTWLWDVLKLNSTRVTLTGMFVAGCLAIFYMAAYFTVDHIVAGSVTKFDGGGVLNAVAAADVVVLFCGLFLIQLILSTDRGREWFEPLRIHAVNGFYVDVLTERMFASAKAD